LKFDKDGNAKWAVTLLGSCKIYAMTADTDGTLYVAGRTEDFEIICTGTDGETKQIVNPTSDPWGEGPQIDAYSAFVAKISKDGAFQSVETVSPSLATPDELMNFDLPLITPTKIVVDNDKVYVSCIFYGNVSSLEWQGSYVSMDYWLGQDIKSFGVFSLSKSDLSGLASVTTVQRDPLVCTYVEGMLEELQNSPDALDFVIYDGVPHVAFIGWGDVKLTSATDNKVFSFTITPDLENPEEGAFKEHGMVLANISNLNYSRKFSAAGHKRDAIPYNLVDATIADGNCILAGTFYGNFPLDNTVTKEFNTSFVASIKMADCSVNWATPNIAESEASCMIVAGKEIKASTDAATYTIKTATGEVKTDMTMNKSFADADVYNDEYVSTVTTDGASVVVFSPKMSPSGIEAIKAAAAKGEMKIFNLNGQRVAQPTKGLFIHNNKVVIIK
jgi:hypothetical protein